MPEEKVGVVVKCDGKYQVGFIAVGGFTCIFFFLIYLHYNESHKTR